MGRSRQHRQHTPGQATATPTGTNNFASGAVLKISGLPFLPFWCVLPLKTSGRPGPRNASAPAANGRIEGIIDCCSVSESCLRKAGQPLRFRCSCSLVSPVVRTSHRRNDRWASRPSRRRPDRLWQNAAEERRSGLSASAVLTFQSSSKDFLTPQVPRDSNIP